MHRALLLCVGLVGAGPVAAQDAANETPPATAAPDPAAPESLAKAQALVDTAVGHFLAKEYDASLKALLEAEGIAVEANDPGLAGIRFNIARCLEELGRPAEALAAYEAYLKLPDESHRKARAWKAAKALEDRVYGRLDVACDPPGARAALAERPDGPSSCPLRLDRLAPGTYHVTVSHPGHVDAERSVDVVAGQTATLAMKLAAAAPATPTPTILAPVPGAQPRRARTNPWPWVTVGVGVLAVAGGGLATAAAMDTRDTAEGLPPGTERDDEVASFETTRAVSYTAYGVGAAALVGGLVWWLVDAPGPVSTTPNGVAFRW